jgi:hypothetical protein
MQKSVLDMLKSVLNFVVTFSSVIICFSIY